MVRSSYGDGAGKNDMIYVLLRITTWADC